MLNSLNGQQETFKTWNMDLKLQIYSCILEKNISDAIDYIGIDFGKYQYFYATKSRCDVMSFFLNKKLCRAFSRQANRLTLHIPVLQGLLRVNSKAEKDAES